MATVCLDRRREQVRRPVHAAVSPASSRLLAALTALSDMSGTADPDVVLQFNDGEVIGDFGLTGPQAEDLARAVERLTRQRRRPG